MLISILQHITLRDKEAVQKQYRILRILSCGEKSQVFYLEVCSLSLSLSLRLSVSVLIFS